jgi:putative inorganic carbon (hco3(-)) transporter
VAGRVPRLLPLGIGLAVAVPALMFAVARAPNGGELAAALVVLAVLASLTFIAWNIDPAWLLIAGIIGSTFNSNWGALGLPGGLPPDRFVLLAGILGVVFRSAAAKDRPEFRVRPVHGLLALTLAWAIGSGIAAQTLGSSSVLFFLLDRMAVPFAVFAVAPMAFNSPRHRDGFITAFVWFGLYLGLTAFFEIVGPHALVFPHFILDVGWGTARAQGPFLEPTVNGVALYVCAVASAIALKSWTAPRKRMLAAATLFFCALGLLFTLTRSVWIASLIATLLVFIVAPGLRRFLLPTIVSILGVVLLALTVLPGFQASFEERANNQLTVWERRNVDAAALNMVSHRPLFGFGVGKFNEDNTDYFTLPSDIPQFVTTQIALHNVFLLMAVELGLIGVTLFAASFLAVVGTAFFSRGPPELRPWRLGILAIAVYWIVGAQFVPLGQVFPNMIIWLWAGIVVGGSMRATERSTNGHHNPMPTHELALRRPAIGEGGA